MRAVPPMLIAVLLVLALAPSVGLTAERCPRVRDIKTWSFYDKPGEDAAFDRLRFTSECDDVVMTALRSQRAMPYDWYSQLFLESDAAVFLLLRKNDLQFLHILPATEEQAWKQQGIFSYFAYVEKADNRKTLINRLLDLIDDVKAGRRPPKRDEH